MVEPGTIEAAIIETTEVLRGDEALARKVIQNLLSSRSMVAATVEPVGKAELTSEILAYMDKAVGEAIGRFLPQEFYKFTLHREQVVKLIDAVWTRAQHSTPEGDTSEV